jgi:hypothetical protein
MNLTMRIRVLNNNGDQLKLSPQINAALDSLGQEAAKSEANWEEATQKMIRVLERDNFDATKLQPEINYYDTKNGKQLFSIKINYTG